MPPINAGKVLAVKGVTVAGVAVASAQYIRLNYNPVAVQDEVRQSSIVTDANDLSIDILGNDARELVTLVTNTIVALVAQVLRDDGSSGTETFADVRIVEILSEAQMPESDAGGKLAEFGVRAYSQGLHTLAQRWVTA